VEIALIQMREGSRSPPNPHDERTRKIGTAANRMSVIRVGSGMTPTWNASSVHLVSWAVPCLSPKNNRLLENDSEESVGRNAV